MMELAITYANGVALIAPAPDAPPATGGECWSIRSAQKRFRRRVTARVPYIQPVSDSELWKQVQGSSACSPRDYILRAIATGEKFSRSDAERMIFGSGLRKSEQHRNFLKSDGLGFDSFIHSLAIPEFYPESYQWDGPTRSSVEMDWMDELESVVAECLSSKHARALLIESFRKAQQKSLEEFAPPF